ncbi:hypothetical protein [Marinobacterium aestuariivivens]|uniref:GNAT family N-acetyltransferase n=1 Tax=Marinobacterium aestuariivivens TaxID=1698799 RepID=A0ABW1ZU59_9GAMM
MSIRFELSKEPHLLAQYYDIREACFRKELGLDSFDGSEDEDDRKGHVLIARDGDCCIGGARISGSTPGDPARLPVESDDFILEELFPELQRQRLSYCQWTRLAILPRYRTTEVLRAQCLALIKGSAELNYGYAFNVTGTVRARLYRRLHKNLGYDYEICDHIHIPADEEFTNLEHLLSVAFIKPEAMNLMWTNRSDLRRHAA